MKNHLFYFVVITLLVIGISCEREEIGIKKDKSLSELPNGLVTLKSGVVVEKKNNNYFIEGDIKLSPTQLKNLDKTGDLIAEKPKYIGRNTNIHPVYNIPMIMISNADNIKIPRAISIYPNRLWAMVRFSYNSNLTPKHRNKIKSALQEMESTTNVRFYNATGKALEHPTLKFKYPYIDFIHIGDKSTSSSSLGRIGGRQKISLADFAFRKGTSNSTIIHEIGHALGLKHEQTRLDRNNYVTINTSNLTPLGLSQFQIPKTNYYQIGTYNYNSIMGYASKTKSLSIVYNTKLPMYTKIDGSLINRSSSLSSSDRKWINLFYIPYIARSDTFAELAPVVYKRDNTIMTPQERLRFQRKLNSRFNGGRTPPNCCRLPNNF